MLNTRAIYYSSFDLGECFNYCEFIEIVITLRCDLSSTSRNRSINFDGR